MQVQEEHDHVVCNDDQMQIIIKGKRTKRQRLPSPLRLAMSTTSRSSTTDNSGGSYDVATTSTTVSIDEFRNRTEELEDHDMANCLILLAQGYHNNNNQHVAAPDHNNNNNKKKITGLYPYQCKTCNRCFPSFQALGGHRTSHKKPNKANSSTTEEKQGKVTTFVNELAANDHHNYDPTSTNLTLQLSNRDLYRSSIATTTTPKSKVHECSICGAEFTSGQALGGHMRRHRTSATLSMSGGNPGKQEAKKPRNVLKLDLNLPAPEDDHREPKFPFQSKEKVIVFSATSLVDCHY
ncbi:zinc finger protein ZAT5-like [Gastrolobium bilobum]|uniref:zinc finger protein ZAT5-like n=1 Tax=Gastrolobium bilobum TaxID=150636 RepID=UPI002AB08BB0|nr:zinc finger protein ZAT5-like [Gastrolobium bilobum]